MCTHSLSYFLFLEFFKHLLTSISANDFTEYKTKVFFFFLGGGRWGPANAGPIIHLPGPAFFPQTAIYKTYALNGIDKMFFSPDRYCDSNE